MVCSLKIFDTIYYSFIWSAHLARCMVGVYIGNDQSGCRGGYKKNQNKIKETIFIDNIFIHTDHCDSEIQVDVATTSCVVTTNYSRKTS